MAKKKSKKKGFTDSGLKTILFAATLTFLVGIFIVAHYSDRIFAPALRQSRPSPSQGI